MSAVRGVPTFARVNPKDLPSLAVMLALLDVIECGGVVPAERKGRGYRGNLHRSVAEITGVVGTKLVEHEGGFRATRAGREVAEGIRTGLQHIGGVISKVRDEARPSLTLVSSTLVAELFLTSVTHELEREHPTLSCFTDSGNEAELRRKLREDEAALAVAADHPGWRGFGRAHLVDVQPVLVAPRVWGRRRLSTLLSQTVVNEMLFYSAASDTLRVQLDAGLKALGVKLPNRRHMASMPAVLRAVAQGHCIGLGVDLPALIKRPGLVVLPWKFPTVSIHAYWRGPQTAALRAAVAALQRLAEKVPGQRRES